MGVLDFDPRDLFDEARGQSRQPKAGDATHTEPMQQVDRDYRGQLDRIQRLVAERGVSAHLLPGMVSRVQNDLRNMTYRGLLTLAGAVGLHPEAFPSDERVRELREQGHNEACEDVQARIIVNSLYGDEFTTLTLEDLRALHKATAGALGKRRPLRDVPMRSILADLVSDFIHDERMRDQIVYALPKHLVEAVVQGRAIVFRLDEPDWNREQRDHFEQFGEHPPTVFDVTTQLIT